MLPSFDADLRDHVWQRLGDGRTDKLMHKAGHLANCAILALDAAIAARPGKDRAGVAEYAASVGTAARMFEDELLAGFAGGGIGLREAGALIAIGWALRAFCEVDPLPHIRGIFRLRFALLGATSEAPLLSIGEGSLASELNGAIVHMSFGNDEIGCPSSAARRFFALGEAEHARRFQSLRDTLTIDDWLFSLLDFSPVNEAQFLVYSMLQGGSEEVLERDVWADRVGADARERAFRLKEYDEYAAHSYANGMMSIDEKAFQYYLEQTQQLKARNGFRAAKRRAIVDVMRLAVPRAIALAVISTLEGDGEAPRSDGTPD